MVVNHYKTIDIAMPVQNGGFQICGHLCENRPCSHLVVIRETLV